MSYLDKDGLAHFWAAIKAYLTSVLANYVKTTDIENFFEIDSDGNLMPSENPTVSNQWELDSDGNIVPKEVS